MPKLIEGKIVKIINETEKTKRFWLEVQQEEILDFKTGQFITMELPIHEKRHLRKRSYSIANIPNDDNLLELCIVKLEGGLATSYLFEKTSIGTTIPFKKPQGVFTLPNVLDKEIIMICTGTGIAPFRSMLLDVFNQNKSHQGIHLIFGTRYEKDILYYNEMLDFNNNKNNFHYSVALSREDHPLHQNGYVHAIYEKEYAEVNPNRVFYLCGWSQMVDEAVERLKKLGYEDRQMKVELYG